MSVKIDSFVPEIIGSSSAFAQEQVKIHKKPTKTVLEKLQEDVRGTFDSTVKRSYTRAILERTASTALAIPIMGVGDFNTRGSYLWYVKNVIVPLQLSYQVVNRVADARGGKLLPQLSAKYEKENGTHKDYAGSTGHIIAKTTDTITNGVVRAFAGSVLASGIITAYGGTNNYLDRFETNWLHGGFFGIGAFDGGGGLAMRLYYRGTLDAGFNAMKALGINKTWPGVLGAAVIGGLGFTDIQSALNGIKSTGNSWTKSMGKCVADRIGSAANAYNLPLIPGCDISKNKRKQETLEAIEKEQSKTDQQKAHDAQVKNVTGIADATYAAFTLLGGIGIPMLIARHQSRKI
jgi:hypothetical protein